EHDDEAEVRLHHPLLRRLVTRGNPLRQLELLLAGEERDLADLTEVDVDRRSRAEALLPGVELVIRWELECDRVVGEIRLLALAVVGRGLGGRLRPPSLGIPVRPMRRLASGSHGVAVGLRRSRVGVARASASGNQYAGSYFRPSRRTSK